MFSSVLVLNITGQKSLPPQLAYRSLTGSQYPGGRALNPAAFSQPADNTAGNYPRNSLRGFPAQQLDMTLRRRFKLREKIDLELRFEVFNVLNHPNFADPGNNVNSGVNLSDSNFGVSSQMLNRGLGSLNALYQMGGPRSAQLAVKLLW
jgi:hypothetical protein